MARPVPERQGPWSGVLLRLLRPFEAPFLAGRLEEVFPDRRPLSAGWIRTTYRSDRPLAGEDSAVEPPFEYSLAFLLNKDRSRLAMAGVARTVVDDVLRTKFGSSSGAWLVPQEVDVDRLVRDLAGDLGGGRTLYYLTFAHVKTEGLGAPLRSVSFYGDDIVQSSLFREHMNQFECYSCGLRSAGEGFEVARLARDGALSFPNIRIASLRRLNEVLLFLKDRYFIGSDTETHGPREATER